MSTPTLLCRTSGCTPNSFTGMVDHAETYVNRNIQTIGPDNFRSLFKRCITGTPNSMEPFQLFRYLDAERFRFNNRKGDDGDRFGQVTSGIVGKRYHETAGTPGEA